MKEGRLVGHTHAGRVVPQLIVIVGLVLLSVGRCHTNLRDLPIPVDIPGITPTKTSDEEQIAALLNDVHQGIQSRHVYRVLAHVSQAYQDDEGRDYKGIQEYLSRLFREYRDIRITRARPQVLIQNNRARVLETFGTVAKPFNPETTPPINVHGQVYVYLEKVGNTWQIVQWGNIL